MLPMFICVWLIDIESLTLLNVTDVYHTCMIPTYSIFINCNQSFNFWFLSKLTDMPTFELRKYFREREREIEKRNIHKITFTKIICVNLYIIIIHIITYHEVRNMQA